MYSCGPQHIDEQRLDDQLELIYYSSVLIQDVAWKTFWEQWTIETRGEGGPGKIVVASWRVDDDHHLLKNKRIFFKVREHVDSNGYICIS